MDSRVVDVKPWFIENLTRLIVGLYFGMKPGVMDRERWIGHLLAWSSLLLAVGGNPEQFMAPEDIQMLRLVQLQSGRRE